MSNKKKIAMVLLSLYLLTSCIKEKQGNVFCLSSNYSRNWLKINGFGKGRGECDLAYLRNDSALVFLRFAMSRTGKCLNKLDSKEVLFHYSYQPSIDSFINFNGLIILCRYGEKGDPVFVVKHKDCNVKYIISYLATTHKNVILARSCNFENTTMSQECIDEDFK